MKKYLKILSVPCAIVVAVFLVAPVAAAPNGMVVNSGTGSVTVFDDATGVVQGSLLIGSGSMGDCSITGDGSTGFATRFNSQVTVIDLTGGAPVLAGPPNPIPISNQGEDTSISPDGQFVVVCDGGNVDPVSVIDIATQTEVSTFALGTDCNSVDVCSDGSVIVTSANAQNVRRLTIDGAGNLADTGDVLFPGGEPNNAVCGPGATSGVVITRGGGGIARSFTIPGLAPVSVVATGFGISMVIDSAGSTLFTRANSVVNAYNYSDATGTIGAPLWGPIAIAATPTFFGMDQMALNPANNRLYVSQPGSLDIYNPATGGFIASILDPNIQTATGICFPSTNVIEVDIDIKFCSNPNGYNCKSRGVTPVTIFGTQDFDASDIIVSTAMLCLADDLDTCTALAPKDSSVADRGDPTTDIGAAQCTVIDGVEQDFLNPDGETDLDIAFHTQDVVNLIGCDTLSKGDASPTLVLIGETNDGSLIISVPIGDVGVDQLLIQKN